MKFTNLLKWLILYPFYQSGLCGGRTCDSSSLFRVLARSAFLLKFFVIVIIMGRKTRANTEEAINEADLSEEGRHSLCIETTSTIFGLVSKYSIGLFFSR